MKKTVLIILLFVASGLIFGKIYNDEKPYEKIGYALDTQIRIVAYGKDVDKKTVDDAYNEIIRLDNLLSNFNENSQTYLLNKKGEMEISPELLEVIKSGLLVSEKTNGKYDITVLPLSDLWNYKKATVPSDLEISEALKKVDYRNIEINDGKAVLKNGAKIDVSSVAKGYIADYIIDYLNKHSVKTALVDAGGNIKVMGELNRNGFKIGIKDPFIKEGVSFSSIDIKNKSVVTSGIYERNFIKDNKTYHHIVDVKTGYPADTDVVSATVISESSAIGDAFATAIVTMGSEEGLNLINSEEDIECIIVTKNKEVYVSSGIKDLNITDNSFKLMN